MKHGIWCGTISVGKKCDCVDTHTVNGCTRVWLLYRVLIYEVKTFAKIYCEFALIWLEISNKKHNFSVLLSKIKIKSKQVYCVKAFQNIHGVIQLFVLSKISIPEISQYQNLHFSVRLQTKNLDVCLSPQLKKSSENESIDSELFKTPSPTF